jgi:hypothetical protein
MVGKAGDLVSQSTSGMRGEGRRFEERSRQVKDAGTDVKETESRGPHCNGSPSK